MLPRRRWSRRRLHASLGGDAKSLQRFRGMRTYLANGLHYSILFYSIILYYILYSIPFYSILFCSIIKAYPFQLTLFSLPISGPLTQ